MDQKPVKEAPPDEEPEERPSAEVIHFPRDRIKRVILKGNKVYNPGPLYPEWDDERAS